VSYVTLADRASAEVKESLAHLLVEARSQGRDDALIVSILVESANLMKQRRPRGSGLTHERARYLVESGTYTAEELKAAESAISFGALDSMVRQTRIATVTDSFSAAEVATMINIDASRVRHRQAKKLLYAFLVGKKRRYPTWQFIMASSGFQPLPHLGAVVEAIPSDMHPASVRGFMTSPKESLRAGGAAARNAAAPNTAVSLEGGPQMSPVEWMAEGGDVRVVLDILETYLES